MTFTARYHGPRSRLTIATTGTTIMRGQVVEVTTDEADRLRASSADVTVTETDDALEGLTVAELRERAALAGLPTSGRKAELLDRLERGA